MKNIRLHDDFWRALLIPAGQALLTGVFSLAPGMGIAILAGYPATYGMIGAGAITLISWLYFRARWTRLVERMLAPEEPVFLPELVEPEPIRIELVHEDGPYLEAQFVDLPISGDQLKALADGLVQGAPLTVHKWTGSRGVFSRAEWESVRYELVRRGLVRAVSPGTPQRGIS